MTAMVRKVVYLKRRQDELLRRFAKASGRSQSAIVREALDAWLAAEQRREGEAAWKAERAFFEWRMAQGPLAGGRTWTPQELYEERIVDSHEEAGELRSVRGGAPPGTRFRRRGYGRIESGPRASEPTVPRRNLGDAPLG